MDGDVENDDVSNVNGSMEHNGFIKLMNYNDSYDNDMNYILKNGDVIRGYGSINRDNLSQFIESSNLNDINRGVETFDVRCGHCYMNSNTIYEAKNPNFMDSTKKRNENVPNLSTIKKMD